MFSIKITHAENDIDSIYKYYVIVISMKDFKSTCHYKNHQQHLVVVVGVMEGETENKPINSLCTLPFISHLSPMPHTSKFYSD